MLRLCPCATASQCGPSLLSLVRSTTAAAACPQPALQVFSVTAVAHAYIMTPKRPHDTGILQVHWLNAAKAASVCVLVHVACRHCAQAACTWTSRIPNHLPLPLCPAPPVPLQAWLQEFAWTEAELPQRLRERQSTLAHADSSRHRGGHKDKTALMSELSKEPMFCFEVGWRWNGCSRS